MDLSFVVLVSRGRGARSTSVQEQEQSQNLTTGVSVPHQIRSTPIRPTELERAGNLTALRACIRLIGVGE